MSSLRKGQLSLGHFLNKTLSPSAFAWWGPTGKGQLMYSYILIYNYTCRAEKTHIIWWMQANPNVAWLSPTGGHWGRPHTFKVQNIFSIRLLILFENVITVGRFHICPLLLRLEVIIVLKNFTTSFQFVLQLCGNSLWCRPLQQPRARFSPWVNFDIFSS